MVLYNNVFLITSRYVEFVRVIDVDIGAESKVPCICPRDKVYTVTHYLYYY